jgi:hypothetical protein
MKRVFTILAVVILIAALPVIIWYVQQTQQKQDIRSNAAPASTLYFVPSTLTKNQSDTFSLDVTINTASNAILVVDLTVNTDPTKIKVTGITPGSFLSTEVVAGSFTDSKATIVRASPIGSPAQGIGVVATVNFQVVGGDGTSEITLTGSKATAHDETRNVLIGTSPATITIGSSGGNPTATVTPTTITTEAPTATPTNIPNATATLTPSPTTAPNNTATVTPTPTQGSSTSGSSSPTSLSLESPASGATINTTTPTFSGVAPAGSTVSITIYSDPITATVTTGSNSRWSYTVTQALSEGTHNVVITAVSSDGTTQTKSSTFTVQTGSMPVTGPGVMTIMLPVVIAASFILLGLAL